MVPERASDDDYYHRRRKGDSHHWRRRRPSALKSTPTIDLRLWSTPTPAIDLRLWPIPTGSTIDLRFWLISTYTTIDLLFLVYIDTRHMWQAPPILVDTPTNAFPFNLSGPATSTTSVFALFGSGNNHIVHLENHATKLCREQQLLPL